MKGSLVKIENTNLIVGTWDLSIGFGMRHTRLKDLINEHKERLEKYGTIKKYGISLNNENLELENENIYDQSLVINNDKKNNKVSRKVGRQIEQYLINEEQYICLVTILPNTEKSLEFKFKLADEFIKMRKILIKLTVNRQNEEWRKKRAEGIIDRKIATDAMQDFANYAKENGSRNFSKYYMVYTKMQNDALLAKERLTKDKNNLRDCIDTRSLGVIQISDQMLAISVAEGIKNKVHYKDLFQEIKNKTEAFGISIGRTPLRLMQKEK